MSIVPEVDGIIMPFCFVCSVATIALFLLVIRRYVSRLWPKNRVRYPRFPTQRTLIIEKDGHGDGCAKPCATNPSFQYHFQDLFGFDTESGQRSLYNQDTTAVDGFWKADEPQFVHPTAPDTLPMELWLPESLIDKKIGGSLTEAAASVSDPIPVPRTTTDNEFSETYNSAQPNVGTATEQQPKPAPVPWATQEVNALSDIEAVLFNERHPRNSFGDMYSPPSATTSSSDGSVWNSPPELTAQYLGDTDSGKGPSAMEQVPATPFFSSTTTTPQSYEPSASTKSHTHYKRPQFYRSKPDQHQHVHHHHHQSNGLPSPPHSARGGSESGSDTNDENSFKCPHCSASFRIRGYLTRHMKKHAEIMKFNCPFYQQLKGDHRCHQTGGFSRRDTFKMHLKARHFAYPSGTSRRNRPNCAGRCCGCNQIFENNEIWIEKHLLTGECPMDMVDHFEEQSHGQHELL